MYYYTAYYIHYLGVCQLSITSSELRESYWHLLNDVILFCPLHSDGIHNSIEQWETDMLDE